MAWIGLRAMLLIRTVFELCVMGFLASLRWQMKMFNLHCNLNWLISNYKSHFILSECTVTCYSFQFNHYHIKHSVCEKTSENEHSVPHIWWVLHFVLYCIVYDIMYHACNSIPCLIVIYMLIISAGWPLVKVLL